MIRWFNQMNFFPKDFLTTMGDERWTTLFIKDLICYWLTANDFANNVDCDKNLVGCRHFVCLKEQFVRCRVLFLGRPTQSVSIWRSGKSIALFSYDTFKWLQEKVNHTIIKWLHTVSTTEAMWSLHVPTSVCFSLLLFVLVARTCNLILIVLDVLKPLGHKKLIEHELEGFGIRLNKQPPNIGFKKKDKGGINFTATVCLE